jgi:lipopolysaccharide heptosyltransferase II
MDKPKRILVIQLKRAGDVIVTTPVLPALREALPGVEIDFLIDKPFAPLLGNNPDIRRVQIYNRKAPWLTWRDMRAASYDWILDFQSSPRSILAGVFSGARLRAGFRVSFWGHFFNQSVKRPGAAVSVTEGKMTLVRALLPRISAAGDRRVFLTKEERLWAAEQMGDRGGAKGAIGLVPTQRRTSRRWPAQSFAHLARLLVSSGRPVWLFWGPGEKDYVEAIAEQAPGSCLIPPASLRQMAALLELCQAVVTNDNGPMHLAVAVGTPTVTLYGPTNPAAWNPGGSKHRVIQASGLGCLGCNMNECPFGHECMAWITPEKVLEVLQ